MNDNQPKPHVLDHFSMIEADAVPGLAWYALNTKPLCERKVVTGLRERGFDAYLPAETDWKRARTGGRERVDRPLIAGYVFVGMGPGKSLYFAMQVEGVSGVIGWGGAARQIAPGFVMDLMSRQSAGEFDHTERRREAYRPGVQAKVLLEGPYKGLVGRILSTDQKGRVELMMCEAYNWRTRATVDQLEIVEDEKAA